MNHTHTWNYTGALAVIAAVAAALAASASPLFRPLRPELQALATLLAFVVPPRTEAPAP